MATEILLSLSFCTACFSLISGLSVIAFVYAGPDKIDMTVVAIVLGLLAPVLAFSIASGSGLNALSNVSQISQNFGLNTGAAYYVPGNGQPSSNNESTNKGVMEEHKRNLDFTIKNMLFSVSAWFWLYGSRCAI